MKNGRITTVPPTVPGTAGMPACRRLAGGSASGEPARLTAYLYLAITAITTRAMAVATGFFFSWSINGVLSKQRSALHHASRNRTKIAYRTAEAVRVGSPVGASHLVVLGLSSLRPSGYLQEAAVGDPDEEGVQVVDRLVRPPQDVRLRVSGQLADT